MSSKKKVAIVTGAARGIGRAIALALAGQGADLVLNYQSRRDAAEEVMAQIVTKGSRALAIKADVADDAQVASMVEQTVREFGRIDILVNNAGYHRGGWVQKIPPQDWERVIHVALKGTFNCCRHIVPIMLERNWGRIINISSNAGLHGSAGDTAYGAAKAGLIGFTKSIAKEVAKKGITANVVVPGFLQTDMTAPLFNTKERRDRELQGIPMGRPGEPAEVAEMVAFLAFQGSYVTGAVIQVDGGMGM
jgi:3-oxoacyl-[acyl-carrier protein] reductase